MATPSLKPPKSADAKRKPTKSETARARRLRGNMTGVERRLWSRLRGGILGVKFRWQEPILAYTVDFVCHERRLIVELDGHQHDAMAAREAKRTTELEKAGYRVLRFWNSGVVDDIDSVVSSILFAMEHEVPDFKSVPVTGIVPASATRSVPPLPPGERPGEGDGLLGVSGDGPAPSPQPSPRGGEGADRDAGRRK